MTLKVSVQVNLKMKAGLAKAAQEGARKMDQHVLGDFVEVFPANFTQLSHTVPSQLLWQLFIDSRQLWEVNFLEMFTPQLKCRVVVGTLSALILLGTIDLGNFQQFLFDFLPFIVVIPGKN